MNAITNQINQRGQNLLAIGQMRQRDQENQRQNALAEKRIGLYEQSNALDQQRFEATQAERKRKIEAEERWKKNDIISNGLSVAASLGAEKGPVYFENFLKVNGITDGPKVDFSYLKPEGGGTITQEIGGGKWVSVEGTGQQLEAFYKANPKSMAELATVVKGTGVKFSQVDPPKPEKDPDAFKREKFQYEVEQDFLNNYTDNTVMSELEGVTKDKNGVYGRVSGVDDVFTPLSGEERMFVKYAQKQGKLISNRARAISRKSGVPYQAALEEAEYDYFQEVAKAKDAEIITKRIHEKESAFRKAVDSKKKPEPKKQDAPKQPSVSSPDFTTAPAIRWLEEKEKEAVRGKEARKKRMSRSFLSTPPTAHQTGF